MNIRNANNFDFIRFVAASLVLFSHSFSLLLNSGSEPLVYLSEGKVSIGRVAVIVFFILSGFLISGSWENGRDIKKFLSARILRIFPGLFVLLILTIFLAKFVTVANHSDYIGSAIKYFIRNILLFKNQYSIIGVFEKNPYGSAINGSLWTLGHEFTCYLIVGFFGLTGLMKNFTVLMLWLMAVLISTYCSLSSVFLRDFLPLLSWFLSGAIVYIHRDWRPSRTVSCAAVALILFLLSMRLSLVYLGPVLAYILIKIVYIRSPFQNFGRYGDFSYGIYIYAFPVQQYVIYLMTQSVIGPATWWLVFLISFPVTLFLAAISWYVVEKRFLKLKRRVEVQ